MSSQSRLENGNSGAIIGIAFLVIALLLGGGSRLDIFGPVFLRLLAIGVVAWSVWHSRSFFDDMPAHAIFFIALLFLLPLVQLVPLPWSMWAALPGRAVVVEMYQALDLKPWQPISLAPERTMNALFALLPPFAMFALAWRMDGAKRGFLLNTIAIVAIASSALGIMQIATGPTSPLYFYRITNADAAVGLFANANHHSLFLCAGLVLAFRWLGEKLKARHSLSLEPMVFGVAAIGILIFSLALTYSRAGALLFVPALLVGLSFIPPKSLRMNPAVFWATASAIALVIGAIFSATLYEKVFGGTDGLGLIGDGRVANVPLFLAIAWDHFPFGGGLGVFDPIYQGYEPVRSIGVTYLNNAHNDPAQILIEGGLLGGVLMILFTLWWGVRSWQIWIASGARGVHWTQQKAASAIAGLAMVHSFADYPLRSASMLVVFAICSVIMLKPSGPHLLKSGAWQK